MKRKFILSLSVCTLLAIQSVPGLGAKPVHKQDSTTPAKMMAGFLKQTGLDADTLSKADGEGPVFVSIDFRYDLPEPRFFAEMEGSAAFLAEFPGLLWKVWGHNANTGMATGAYLFSSMQSAKAYTEMLFPAGPPKKEGYGDFDILVTRVLDKPSRITRAPMN